MQLLKTGSMDDQAGTITIPSYLGDMKNGTDVWYVLLDVDDAAVAAELGLNFSAAASKEKMRGRCCFKALFVYA